MKRKVALVLSLFLLSQSFPLNTAAGAYSISDINGFSESEVCTDGIVSDAVTFKEAADIDSLLASDYVLMSDSETNYGLSDSNSGSNSFYYDQLSARQQAAYDALDEACSRFVKSDITVSTDVFDKVVFTSLSGVNELSQVYWTFYYSHPEYYFLKNHYKYTTNYNTVYLECYENCRNSSERKKISSKINSVTSGWLSQVKSIGSNAEKEKKLAHLICDSTVYDTESEFGQSVMGPLYYGSSVCNGYAMTMYYLCNLAGIKNIIVTGNNHAWNRVKIDGSWYETDVTWMDQTDYYWNIWLDGSTADFQRYDSIYSSSGTKTHAVKTSSAMYTNITLPKCTKTGVTQSSAVFSLVKQPDNQTVMDGETAKFKVEASGSGLTYQWYWRANENSNWGVSGQPGNKTAELSVQGLPVRNSLQFSCVITDENGEKIRSNAVTLNVTGNLKITGQPENQTVKNGETAKFSVKAEGRDLTYQWNWRANENSSWGVSGQPGNKTAELSVQGLPVRNGMQFSCVVTDADGNKVRSNAVTLKLAEELKITRQPESKTVKNGETAKFKVEAEGVGLTYQWNWRANENSNWGVSGQPGNKTAELSVQGLPVRNGMQFSCVVTDADGNKVRTNAVTLKLAEELKITKQPESQTVKNGETAKFKVEAEGVGLTYQWYWRANENSNWGTSGQPGNKTAELSVQGLPVRNGMQFSCVITDADGNKIRSNAVTLKLAEELKITRQPESQTVKNGETAKFKVEAEGTGLTYRWYWRANENSSWGLSGQSGNKTAELSMQGLPVRNGMQFSCVVKDSSGKEIRTEAVTLTVK